MKPATVVFTRPRKEGDPTSVTYEWCGKAVQMAKDYGYHVIDLKGSDVTYDNVSRIIKETRPRLYIHMGHGCANSLQGQNECIVTRRFGVDELVSMPNFKEIIMPLTYKSGCIHTCKLDNDPCSPFCMSDTNIGLFKDTIMTTVACYSGEQLGKCAVKYGATGYYGYDDLFLFPVDTEHSENLFGDIHLVYIRELLEGKSVAEAERTMSLFEDSLIRKYKKTKYLGLSLLWNKIHRTILGNKGAYIYGQ